MGTVDNRNCPMSAELVKLIQELVDRAPQLISNTCLTR